MKSSPFRQLSPLGPDSKPAPATGGAGVLLCAHDGRRDRGSHRRLPPAELAKLRVWFAEFETGMPPPQTAPETTTKLGRLAGRTIADLRKRTRDNS